MSRDRLLFQIAVAAGSICLVILVIGGAGFLHAPQYSAVWSYAFAAAFFSGMTFYGTAIQFMPKYKFDRSWYSPVRVGFSSRGIHVEYDPASARRRTEGEAARTFIPWDDIDGVVPPPSPYTYKTQVQFRCSNPLCPRLVQVSPELVDRIKSEVAIHIPEPISS